jgi:hypothetical protein
MAEPRPGDEAVEAVIVNLADLEAKERIAAALAEWSSDKPWAERHPKNRLHWLYVAEALMSNEDAIIEPVLAYARARKAGEDPAALACAHEFWVSGANKAQRYVLRCKHCKSEFTEGERLPRASLRGPVEAGTDEPSSGDAISVEGQLGAERLTSDTDGCKELVQLAAWWASEMAGNEVRVEGFTLPPAFREMVARWMVEDPDLGWPDLESAHVELEELYPNA